MSQSKHLFAGQAEILRASQRDEATVQEINNLISELNLIGGRELWLKCAAYHAVIARLLYYLCTNARWLQTLGEEYTGIIPVERNGLRLLSFHKMLLYVILLSGGNVILTSLLKKFQNIESASWISNSVPKKGLKRFFYIFQNIIPYLDKLNKAIFYFDGSYLSIVNRLTGVKHVLVRSWLRDKESVGSFKILAIISSINLVLSLFTDFQTWSKLDVESYTANGTLKTTIQNSCRLCLNLRQSTSVTPCGHLFCWDCIMKWLQIKRECPFCKAPINMSRVVFLQNYDQFRE